MLGAGGHSFPWGALDDVACRPNITRTRVQPGAVDVDAFRLSQNSLGCASPFNVSDLLGNVYARTVFVPGSPHVYPDPELRQALVFVPGSPHVILTPS